MKSDQEKKTELGKELTRLLLTNLDGVNDDQIEEIAIKLEKLRGFALPKQPRKKK